MAFLAGFIVGFIVGFKTAFNSLLNPNVAKIMPLSTATTQLIAKMMESGRPCSALAVIEHEDTGATEKFDIWVAPEEFGGPIERGRDLAAQLEAAQAEIAQLKTELQALKNQNHV